jgi:cation/acetate symporter
LGIAWKGANRIGVVCGMLGGLGVTVIYMVINASYLRTFWGLDPNSGLWFGIQPVSAGVFGVPLGFALIAVVSWVTRAAPPPQRGRAAPDSYPGL